jgi:hypothetical protein
MLLVACATKIASSTAGPFTTLDPTQTVDELDPVSASHLCLDVQIFAATALTDDRLRDFECVSPVVYAGGADKFGADQCQSFVDHCNAIPAGQPVRQPLDFGACDEFLRDRVYCQATVGDVGACLDALAWSMDQVAQQRGAVCKPGYDGLPPDPRFYEPWSRCSNCVAVIQYAQRLMLGGSVSSRVTN